MKKQYVAPCVETERLLAKPAMLVGSGGQPQSNGNQLYYELGDALDVFDEDEFVSIKKR